MRNLGNQFGRKTVLTPELVKTFTDCLKLNATIKTASEVSGINEGTYQLWKRTAAKALNSDKAPTDYESKCLAFIVQCRIARGKAKQLLLANAMKHVLKDKCETCGRQGKPGLGLKILAQCHPEEYSPHRVTRLKLEGAGGGPVQVQIIDPREMLRQHLGNPQQMKAAESLSHAEIQHRINSNNNGNGYNGNGDYQAHGTD